MTLEELKKQKDLLFRIINNMRVKGLDPTKFYDAKNDNIINLVTIFERIDAQIHIIENPIIIDFGKGPMY